MRSALALVALVPILTVLELALWVADPERRLLRSALAAGLVVGRVATGAAW